MNDGNLVSQADYAINPVTVVPPHLTRLRHARARRVCQSGSQQVILMHTLHVVTQDAAEFVCVTAQNIWQTNCPSNDSWSGPSRSKERAQHVNLLCFPSVSSSPSVAFYFLRSQVVADTLIAPSRHFPVVPTCLHKFLHLLPVCCCEPLNQPPRFISAPCCHTAPLGSLHSTHTHCVLLLHTFFYWLV